MLQGGFVVAMAATINVANYDKPTDIVRPMRKWTIVSRFGPESEHLTVSVTHAMLEPEAAAPIGLSPVKTAFGILLSETDSESMFLLVRHLPRDVRVAGTFFPADGYARLRGSPDRLLLQVEGRHAHSRGHANARDVRYDVPEPAPGAKWTMAWHIDAERRPWTGEFLASRRAR